MLSAESAAGKYPLGAVRIMDRIIAEVEADPHYRKATDAAHPEPEPTIADAICCALRRATSILPVGAVVTYTTSGSTALRAARERPAAPILGLTPDSRRHAASRWSGARTRSRCPSSAVSTTWSSRRAPRHREGSAGRARSSRSPPACRSASPAAPTCSGSHDCRRGWAMAGLGDSTGPPRRRGTRAARTPTPRRASGPSPRDGPFKRRDATCADQGHGPSRTLAMTGEDRRGCTRRPRPAHRRERTITALNDATGPLWINPHIAVGFEQAGHSGRVRAAGEQRPLDRAGDGAGTQHHGGIAPCGCGSAAASPRARRQRDARASTSSRASPASRARSPGSISRPRTRRRHSQVQAWMEQAGMRAGIDAVGNVVGRYEGRAPGLPALLLGSHIDTVRNAGKYDGNLGVVAAIEAVAALHAARRAPAVRDRGAGLRRRGRGALPGDAHRLARGGRHLRRRGAGRRATPTASACARRSQQFGCDPCRHPRRRPPHARTVLGYVELHIEQGPVLEAEGLPVGVVTAINGASRASGRGDGRGRPCRHGADGAAQGRAGAAAAEMVLAVERAAPATAGSGRHRRARSRSCPGAVNVIPAAARFTLDIRSPRDRATRDALNG